MVAVAVEQLPAGLVLDGELLVWDPEAGALSFEALQRRAAARAHSAALVARTPAYFVAFDVLQIDGQELLQARPTGKGPPGTHGGTVRRLRPDRPADALPDDHRQDAGASEAEQQVPAAGWLASSWSLPTSTTSNSTSDPSSSSPPAPHTGSLPVAKIDDSAPIAAIGRGRCHRIEGPDTNG
ncbi:hypothetical protein [Streptomyces sp. NPDC059874]|uniref:ATP-dependent DNA ligase n=1 Tax=Streptomyces sp. NPDC059874 TaxID=3346983 RepID=UPI003656C1E5